MADDMDVMRYGLTALEEDAQESTQAWAIVNEITSFGVSQKQMLLIIKRLALNLENRDHMRQINKLVDEIIEDDPTSSSLVLNPDE